MWSRELHQLVEDEELQFQFDGVNEALVGDLDVILPEELKTKQGDVENDNEDVDIYKMSHDSASGLLAETFRRLQKSICFPHIHAGNDEFLDAKGGYLYPLHDHVWIRKLFGLWRIRTEGEDGRGDVEQEDVDDDHGQDPFDLAFISDDEV